MTAGLEKLYSDKGGDLLAIFDVLGEDPGKAMKYPPSSALEFATKYLEGGYTYVEVRKQPSKPKLEQAINFAESGDSMTKAFAGLYTQHGGDLTALFAELGEDPKKALKYPPKDAAEFATKYIAGHYTYEAKTTKTPPSPPPAAPMAAEDPMLAALAALYNSHGGDLAAIFGVLGEDPKKALKYPPKDAAAFATKYLEGCYTYYTAPVESEASVASRMEAQDEALTPMEVLLMLFPDVDPALLEAAFQEANGHLEQTVELLLTAMFFSSLDTNAAQFDFEDPAGFLPSASAADGAARPPAPPGLSDLASSELGEMRSNGEDLMDQVLALTVPPGAVAGDLVRFVTPHGAIVAEVPEGVEEGQPFFVRLTPVL
jgi:hypothetical protein